MAPMNMPEDTAPAPGAAAPLPDHDADDLARLLDHLRAHVRSRLGAGDAGVCPEELLRGVCLALVVKPAELGPRVESVLRDPATDDLPEARACRLWLHCAAGQATAEAGAELEALARAPLWGPVQALAYRALAWLGRRQLLA